MKNTNKMLLCSGLVALSYFAVAQDKQVWVTIGNDAATALSNQKLQNVIAPSYAQPYLDLNIQSTLAHSEESVSVMSIPESQVLTLSHYMHHAFNRCGGFVYHASKEEALAYAKRDKLAKIKQQYIVQNYTIDNPNGVSSLLTKLEKSNLTAVVNKLSAYYNRYYTSSTGKDSATWIKNRWASLASGRSDISVKFFNHSDYDQPSVIATIKGTTDPDDIVIIGGHLDSINGSNHQGKAPGADDNASGIAVLTTTLQAIIDSGYKPAKTIQLMGYAAEEVGLRGSKDIARVYKSQNKNVIGVAQFDMTGVGNSNADIVFMTDYTNQNQTNFMKQLIDRYLSDVSYDEDKCGYACSDHASWYNEGFAASMPFESRSRDMNRKIHTVNDTQFDPDHSFNFARLAATFVAELAKGGTGDDVPPTDNVLKNNVPVSLSVKRGQSLNYTFDVPNGATNIKVAMSGGTGDADLYVKRGQKPTDSSYDCRPYKNGNDEACTLTTTGKYYVTVKGYSATTGVTLVGTYDEEGDDTPKPINKTIENISVATRQWNHFDTLTLPEGYKTLKVIISGGTGDADLYVRRGAQATTSSYECRPYKNGNAETCTITNPKAGVWYFSARGYRDASDVKATISAEPQ